MDTSTSIQLAIAASWAIITRAAESESRPELESVGVDCFAWMGCPVPKTTVYGYLRKSMHSKPFKHASSPD